jgi:hypothetical protein
MVEIWGLNVEPFAAPEEVFWFLVTLFANVSGLR